MNPLTLLAIILFSTFFIFALFIILDWLPPNEDAPLVGGT
jgi:hypothetical protein